MEKATGAVYKTDGAAGHPVEVGRWDGASIVFHSGEDGEPPVPLLGASDSTETRFVSFAAGPLGVSLESNDRWSADAAVCA